MNIIISYKLRPYIYAAIVTIGFGLLFNLNKTLEQKYFFTSVLVVYTILVFEIISTSYHGKNILKQLKLKNLDAKHKDVQLIHHLIIPSMLYFSMVFFIFSNNLIYSEIPTLTIAFIFFSMLFANIRAYYSDDFTVALKTTNIYDFISIICVFFFSFSIFKLGRVLDINNYLVLVPLNLINGTLGLLVMIRYHILSTKRIIVMLGLLLVFNILLVLLVYFSVSIVLASGLTTMLFYYFTAVANHLEDNTFEPKILLEYLVIFLLTLLFISNGLL